MSNRQRQPPLPDNGLCRRCREVEPAIVVRKEPLCNACFDKYVQTKVVKRMETFRVKNSEPGQEKTLLLPLSFGPCSTALLYTVSRHLQGQIEKTGRTGYNLHILHVHDDESSSASDTILDQVRQRYPQHTYSNTALSSVTEHAPLLPSSFQDILATNNEQSSTPSEKLVTLLTALPSATSRADAAAILLRKLITHHAQAHSCAAILYGDSTTRLSERTLAETAKGRGFSLPWAVSDGDSPFGLPIYYPLRDLLSKEIAAFVDFVEPTLGSTFVKNEIGKPAASMKNSTIDDLTRQYFASVEADYPSIVANVVRTTSKLQARSLREVELQCELCDMPLEGQAPERSRLCYGCIRTMPQVTA
ncbi:hypothetical protein Q7P37_002191 [Cladosporium fusiforme]